MKKNGFDLSTLHWMAEKLAKDDCSDFAHKAPAALAESFARIAGFTSEEASLCSLAPMPVGSFYDDIALYVLLDHFMSSFLSSMDDEILEGVKDFAWSIEEELDYSGHDFWHRVIVRDEELGFC